jgi:DNA-binding NarL/FixJ family response regulator
VQALVLKNADPDHLITAIRHVRQGRRFTSPDLRDKTYRICSRLIKNMDPSQNRTEGPAKNPETSSLLDTITNTEMGIMLCIAQGHSTKEVAKRFQFTDGTVRNYLSSGMKKTGLKRRTQIHQLFLKQGLL